MKKFDWLSIIKNNIIILKIVGLWPQDEAYKFDAYSIWAIGTLILINFGHNFFQIVNLVFLFGNLKAVVRISYVTLSEVIAFVKAYYMIKHMKTLKELMVILRSDLFQPKNEQQLATAKENFSFWKIISYMYWAMSAGSIFFWAIHPMFDKSEDALPFLAWYPWSISKWPNYHLTYLHQVFGVMFIASTAISTDTLIAALNVYISAQFDILCDNIIHVFDNTNDSCYELNKKLIHCICHHKQIVNFARKTNKIANWIVLGQFFVSGVTIGITLFLLTVTMPFSSEFYSCISFTFSMTLEIFMYCWFGNEVETKSIKVVYAVFKSKWISTPIQLKKHIMFFVLRCQTPLRMSALNLFYLSLDTFMRILRASWSYFALLHQVTTR